MGGFERFGRAQQLQDYQTDLVLSASPRVDVLEFHTGSFDEVEIPS